MEYLFSLPHWQAAGRSLHQRKALQPLLRPRHPPHLPSQRLRRLRSRLPGGGKTTVQFWHCMSGTNGDLINQMVSDFNSSQDEVEVVATFQGSYAEAAAKAEQAIFAGNAPDILQVAQDNVGRLAVNGAFADLLPFMQKDGFDDKGFVDAFVNDAYYDGKLVVVPFGRSARFSTSTRQYWMRWVVKFLPHGKS